MTDVDNTIEYYKDLLLYQYINQPNARATVGLLCSQAIVDLLPIEINKAFNINTAIGPQLDILGEYIGLNRVINAPVLRDYFSFDDYVFPRVNAIGFTDYTDLTLNANASVYEYITSNYSLTTLSDAEYRILLKLKLLSNMSQNCLYEVNEILYEVFGNDVVVFDQFDMTISYFVKNEISRIMGIALSQNLLPKPMAVLISGLFGLDIISSLWGLTDYTRVSWSTIGFSDYATGFEDSTVLDYTDRIA
jgi:hypothetical protein